MAKRSWPTSGAAVTISDQAGSGAHEIARRLAVLLEAKGPKAHRPMVS